MDRMEYTGPIPELQGKTALVRKVPYPERAQYVRPDRIWLAQFDDTKLIINGALAGIRWHPVPKSHFTTINEKMVF